MSSKVSEDTSDREIVISRLIDAPRELVWQAYSDPSHITHWWGPRGFTTTTHSMDMRPGGEWRFIMHGPDGTDYKNRVSYIEVEKPARLVWHHSGEEETADIKFTSHVTFEDRGGKTLVTLRLVLASKAERDRIEAFSGATEGGKQTLARLSEYILELTNDGVSPLGKPFVITRVFNTPREMVWRAWTEEQHLKHWWGPKGCKIEIAKLDFRPGGIFHYVMRYSTGAAMWGRFTYVDIVAPGRLVYLSCFSDEAGGITRAPFPGTGLFPLEIENTVTFEERKGKTTITLHGLPHNASDEERTFFEGMFASMQGGFGGTFDQLEKYLERV